MTRAILFAALLGCMPAALAAPAPAGDPAAGAAAFRKCASCHQVGPQARAGFGPHLNGLFGRRAGSTEYRYSAAMKKSGIVWNDSTLAAFLRDPGDVVPGTKMRFWGIGDERQIANLLAYLRQYR
ncbi:cytochrome c [Pseudoduganella flava]|uniref:C-type cytochrome n=1 Tax=Pseudoduganella flava TaxID=871742 RepID=A0A562PIQ8_9BURK|nr:c-type cytochrome [Pseudoduganella flava]QGZ42799.1 c-type cytochrome [Pseudoduganella flava]TWI44100.1 cytochrome c [Pseudoduganella flava]